MYNNKQPFSFVDTAAFKMKFRNIFGYSLTGWKKCKFTPNGQEHKRYSNLIFSSIWSFWWSITFSYLEQDREQDREHRKYPFKLD